MENMIRGLGMAKEQVAGFWKYVNELSGVPKIWGIYWVYEELLASQQVLCSMELYERGYPEYQNAKRNTMFQKLNLFPSSDKILGRHVLNWSQ